MKTLYELSDRELDAFFATAERSLADQAAELSWSPEPGDIRAAMDTTVGILRELTRTRPTKAAVIDRILKRYAS